MVLRVMLTSNSEKILKSLISALPLNKAASIAAEITGESKNDLYKLGLKIQRKKDL